MDIKFVELEYGWCRLNIYDSYGNCYDCYFDELLDDPFPNFVRAYLKVKNHQEFAWITADGDGIEVWIKFVDENKVRIRLKIIENSYGDFAIIDEIMEKDKFLSVLETLFDDVLSCLDFPYSFPCHSCYDEDEYNRCNILSEEYCKKHPEEDEDEVFKMMLRENAKLNKETTEFANKYRRMLTEYIVPDGWCVRGIIEDGE